MSLPQQQVADVRRCLANYCKLKAALEKISVVPASAASTKDSSEETANLWEPWMRQADQALEDEQLVKAVYEALLKRVRRAVLAAGGA